MSQIVPSKKQNNVLIQNAFLDALADSIAPETKVFIMADAGFQSAWFQHVKSLGWEFIGRIRGNVRFCLLRLIFWGSLSPHAGGIVTSVSRGCLADPASCLLEQHYGLTLNDTPFNDERVIQQHIDAGISLTDALNFIVEKYELVRTDRLGFSIREQSPFITAIDILRARKETGLMNRGTYKKVTAITRGQDPEVSTSGKR